MLQTNTSLCPCVCDRGRKHTHAFLTEQFLSGTKEAMSLFNWTREEFANHCGFASTPSSLTNVNSSSSQTLLSLRSGTVVHNVLCSFFSNYFAAGAMYLWKRKPPKWQCSYCLWPFFWVITDLICSEEEISKIFLFGTGIELLGFFGWFIIKIMEYTQRKGTHRDHPLQLLAMHRHPKNPSLCQRALYRHSWSSVSLGAVIASYSPPNFPTCVERPLPGVFVCPRKGKVPRFQYHKAATLTLALTDNTGSALPFTHLSKFWGCFLFQSISSKRLGRKVVTP